MKERINSILQLAEKTAMFYTKYVIDNEIFWPDEEKKAAKVTLGGLTALCYQVKEELNANKEYNEQEQLALDYELKKVEMACNTILSHLQ